ncbi:hypothetical protein IT418_03290 [bacterium]|nr:hypothetical protein [bacterium]
MNTILNIFRWVVGLCVALVMFGLVIFLVPLSVVGKQIFVKETGMAIITSFAGNEHLVSATLDGVFDGAINSNMIEDPGLLNMVKLTADDNSPLGAAFRKVVTTESLKVALIENGSLFYDWLASDSTKLNMKYVLGGTDKDKIALLSVFMRTRYDALDKCTAAQRTEIGRVDADKVLVIPCSVGAIATSTFDAAAKKMLGDKEAKEILNKGIPLLSYEENSKEAADMKANIKKVQQSISSGPLVTWVVIALSAMLMSLLFTPSGMNFIATGFVLSLTGMVIYRMSRVVLYGSTDSVLVKSIGEPISAQGAYIALVSLVFVGLGIWQLTKKEDKVKTPTDETARKAEQILERVKN